MDAAATLDNAAPNVSNQDSILAYPAAADLSPVPTLSPVRTRWSNSLFC